MENTILEPKYRRIFRSWTDEQGKTSFDVIVNMRPELRRVTAIKTTKNADGSETSEFAVVREDDTRAFVTCEMWKGSKIKKEGKVESESNRVYIGQPNYDVGHLFVSEIYDNALNCYNQTSSIGTICEKILDFVKIEASKKQSKLG
jgi:hypothetical protein